jgi:hypothetical protein
MNLSCEHCEALCEEQKINSPSALRKALIAARDNLDDGTLRELPHQISHQVGASSFLEVANGTAWEDIVNFEFECNHCGQQFQLRAETYHGVGGAWRRTSLSAAHAL